MVEINVQPEQIVAVWAMVTVLRALIPARLANIDGPELIWPLVLVASGVVYVQQNGGIPEGSGALWSAAVSIVTMAAAAIMADGGAERAGLKTRVRSIATLGGRTNKP